MLDAIATISRDTGRQRSGPEDGKHARQPEARAGGRDSQGRENARADAAWEANVSEGRRSASGEKSLASWPGVPALALIPPIH